jgi:hypothetical protein
MSRGASEGASVRIFLLHGRNRLTSHIILLFGRVRELQGDGTWLIDDEGRPVAPVLLWLDSRAARLAEEIQASPQNARRSIGVPAPASMHASKRRSSPRCRRTRRNAYPVPLPRFTARTGFTFA